VYASGGFVVSGDQGPAKWPTSTGTGPRTRQNSFKERPPSLVGGQIKGQEPQLYMIYPQRESSTRHARFTLPANRRDEVRPADPSTAASALTRRRWREAAKYALISLDSTIAFDNDGLARRSTCWVYDDGELQVPVGSMFHGHRPAAARLFGLQWGACVRQAVQSLPSVHFEDEKRDVIRLRKLR